MVYVGVDLHRKRSHVVALDPTGEVVLSRRIGNAPAEFYVSSASSSPSRSRWCSRPPTAGAGSRICWPMSASPLIWPTRWPPRRSRPPGSRTTPSMPRPWRTCCAPTCWLRPGSPASTPRRPAGLVRTRWAGPDAITGAIPVARAAGRPGCHPRAHHPVRPAGRWLAELPMPASARGRLDAGLRLIDAITVEVAHADADLRACLAGDHRVRRLLPIPGVGLVTAATVVAEVWDIQRFPSPERLCRPGSPPGSAPAMPIPAAHITKQGSRWLRWMLVEAATTAVRDPQLDRFTAQIAQRRALGIARGGAGLSVAHPVLLRPARRRRLPCLPRPRTIAGSVVRRARCAAMALLCNGRRLD